MYKDEIVFVLKPSKVIEKYEDDMEYTDFGNGQTRSKQRE